MQQPKVRKKAVTKASTQDTPERFRMSELGYSGLAMFNGVSNEELKRELNFPNNIKIYKQMMHAVKNNLLEVRGTAKYTKEFKTLVYNFYIENKISIKKLAEHFSISERTAGRIAQGVEPRKTTRVKKDGTVIVDNIITKEQVLEIKALRESGWTFAKLSERFNRGMSQIHRIVNDKSRVSEIE